MSPVRIINEAHYKPVKLKKLNMPWENSLFLGIELELEGDSNDYISEVAKELKNKLDKIGIDIFYFKEDGSLDHGIELVSHPVTLQFIHENLNFKDMFRILQDLDFRAESNCGLHVHMSKRFFTKNDLYKLRLFFSKNADFLIKFSRRNTYNVSRWCRYDRRFSIKQFLNDKKNNLNMREEGACRGMACAIYSHYSETIEIRAFSSTTDYKTFMATLQFCDAIAHFIKDISIVYISKKDSKSLFIDWCKRKGNYNILVNYLKGVE